MNWVLLTQTRSRITIFRENLLPFEANTADFDERFVAMGEFWAHHSPPQNKQQSVETSTSCFGGLRTERSDYKRPIILC